MKSRILILGIILLLSSVLSQAQEETFLQNWEPQVTPEVLSNYQRLQKTTLTLELVDISLSEILNFYQDVSEIPVVLLSTENPKITLKIRDASFKDILDLTMALSEKEFYFEGKQILICEKEQAQGKLTSKIIKQYLSQMNTSMKALFHKEQEAEDKEKSPYPFKIREETPNYKQQPIAYLMEALRHPDHKIRYAANVLLSLTSTAKGKNYTISLEVQEQEFLAVINDIAKQTGIELTIDPEIKGKVSFYGKDIPVVKALQVITQQVGVDLIPTEVKANDFREYPALSSWESESVLMLKDRLQNIPVTVEFNETPLTDILDFLRAISDINIVEDPAIYQKDIPKLTLSLAEVKMQYLVRHLTQFLGVKLVIKKSSLLLLKPNSKMAQKYLVFQERDYRTGSSRAQYTFLPKDKETKLIWRISKPLKGLEPVDHVAIKQRLEQSQITVNFEQADFLAVLNFLRNVIGINFALRSQEVEASVKKLKIDFKHKKDSAKTILEKLLESHNLSYKIDLGIVLITQQGVKAQKEEQWQNKSIPELVKHLQDKEWRIREKSCYFLGEKGNSKEVLHHLLKAQEDENIFVRSQARKALYQPFDIQLLLEVLSESKRENHNILLKAMSLYYFEDPKINFRLSPMIMGIFTDPEQSEENRVLALNMLGRIGKKTPAFLSLVIAALDDPAPKVKAKALEHFFFFMQQNNPISYPAISETIYKIAKSKESQKRRLTIHYTPKLLRAYENQVKDVTGIIIDGLSDPFFSVQMKAIKALKEIPSEKLLSFAPTFRKLLTKEFEPDFHYEVIRLLVSLKEENIETLRSLLKFQEKEKQKPRLSLEQKATLTKDILFLLTNGLTAANSFTRKEVMKIIKEKGIKEKQIIEALEEALYHSTQEVKRYQETLETLQKSK